MSHDAFFGTDGIRERFGEGRLSPDNLRRIGRALAGFAKERLAPRPRIFVARDPRPTGVPLLEGIAEGMTAEGVVAEDGGVLPTPAIAWFTSTGACDMGVALTASHNPPADNGVKVFLPGGRKTTPAEEHELDARIRAADPAGVTARTTPRPDAVDAYVDAAVRFLEPGGRLGGARLSIDCANGATARTARRILERLDAGVDTTVGSDGAGAINDHCGTEHPERWRAAVRAVGGIGGIAFDGDGDRVLLCDEHGEVLDGDPLLHLLARDLDERGLLPGRVVVATVMSNLGLEQALSARGIGLDRVPVGDRHVAARMRELGAGLGGEQSGHILLRWGNALVGDGVVAGVVALQAARRHGLTLSAARAEVVKCPQILRNVHVARKVPLDQAAGFSAAVRAEEEGFAGRGRVVVRYSGTEPLLRIMVEGPDAASVSASVDRLTRAAATIV